MGAAAAHYLGCFANAESLVLVDVDASVHQKAQELQARLTAMGKTVKVKSSTDVDNAIRGLDGVVAACGYQSYVDIARKCIEAGVHMVDLGGNRDVVGEQKELNDLAVNAGVTHIPDQGLAPGAINIFAMNSVDQLNAQNCKDVTVVMRVGGLPVDPGSPEENPMRYKCTWSPDGLINEYLIPADVIEDGVKKQVPALSGLEHLRFPNGHTTEEFEAFVTGGGSSNLPELLDGKVKNVNYKTIRYVGHHAVAKSLQVLGLYEGEGRRVLTDAFENNMKLESNDDIIIARAGARGVDPQGKTYTVGTDMVCVLDPITGLSAMAQTTGYSAAIVLNMIVNGLITERGVVCGESVVPGRTFIDMIRETGIEVGPMGSLG